MKYTGMISPVCREAGAETASLEGVCVRARICSQRAGPRFSAPKLCLQLSVCVLKEKWHRLSLMVL